MSESISEASVKRSAAATSAKPSLADGEGLAVLGADVGVADGSPGGRVGGGEQRPRRLAQGSARRVAASAVAVESRIAQPRRSADIAASRATATSASAALGAALGGWVWHVGDNSDRVLGASVLADRRRRLRDRRDPARPQRLHRLLDRRRRGRRAPPPSTCSRHAAPGSGPPVPPPRAVANGAPRARRGSAPRSAGSRPRSRSRSACAMRVRALERGARSGTAGAGRCSGARPRGGRGACGSRRSRERARARRRSRASIRSSSSAGGASSTSTRLERVRIRIPATTIATATQSAAIASKAGSPVISTRTRPTSTPTEVSASVRRWAASPSSAGESSARARR